MAVTLCSFNPHNWGREQYIKKLLPDAEHPIIERFRRLNLLDFDGSKWGASKEGKHYPQIDQWTLCQILVPYEEKIRELNDPVIIAVPELERYNIKDLNKLESQTQLKKYDFDDRRSVLFPSPEAVSERWRDKDRKFKETFGNKHFETGRNRLNGHHYETPFPGWSVFVCEKALHGCPAGTRLEDIASSAGYIQLTAKEAFVLRAMDLCNSETDEAEVLLGQYNPDEDKFPVLVQRPFTNDFKNEFEIDGVDAQKMADSEIPGPGRHKKILKVRKGFRLQTLTKVADHIVSRELKNTHDTIENWTRDRLGQPLDVTITPEMRKFANLEKPTDNLSVVMIAIDVIQQQCRMAIEKLIEAGRQHAANAEEKGREAESLRQQLANANSRIEQLIAETQALQLENERLSGVPKARGRAAPTGPGQNTFNIQRENLGHLDLNQLRKLQRDLAKYFHPDQIGRTASQVEKERANRQFQIINDMIAAEIKRKE